jgi:hypothetical protein
MAEGYKLLILLGFWVIILRKGIWRIYQIEKVKLLILLGFLKMIICKARKLYFLSILGNPGNSLEKFER